MLKSFIIFMVLFSGTSCVQENITIQDEYEPSVDKKEALIETYLLEKVRPEFLTILSEKLNALGEMVQGMQETIDRQEHIYNEPLSDQSSRLISLEFNLRELQERTDQVENIMQFQNLCPSSEWKIHDDVCYLFVSDVKVTWDQAKSGCKSFGQNSDLVSIEHPSVNNFINTNGNSEKYWTSGNDKNVEGKWVWGSVNRYFIYTDWVSREPNNIGDNGTGADCMVIDTKQQHWRDKNCSSDKFPYICQQYKN